MSVVFRAEDEPTTTRFDYWCHVMRDLLGPVELRAPEDPDFRDWLRATELGPVQVADIDVTQPGSEGVRTEAHARRSGAEHYVITVHRHGRAVVEQGSRQVVLGPGDLTLVDLSRPTRFAGGPFGAVDIVFPRDLLPLRADDLARVTGVRIPGDRGFGALASSLARRLPADLAAAGEADGAHASRLGTATLDLITTALAAHLDRDRDVPPETRQGALVRQIYAFVEEHLADPDLSPPAVAAAHFVSLRYLHKLFEAEQTTVADHIRRRRLERCRQDLLDPARRALPVAAIAARWGFADPAHFSRLFRAVHGLPPAEYRRLFHGRDGRRDPA